MSEGRPSANRQRTTDNRPQTSRILVRRVCGLGDLVLTVPFLRALNALHPLAHIHFMGNPEHGALIEAAGLTSRTFPEDGSGWHILYSGGPLPREAPLVPDPTTYDQFYLFVPNPAKSPLLTSLTRLFPGQVNGIPARPPSDAPIHASRFFLSHLPPIEPDLSEATSAQMSEMNSQILGFRLSGSNEHGRVAPFACHGPVILHPGSGSPSKNWPPERFASILERLVTSFPCVDPCVLEGPSDGEAVRAVWRCVSPGPTPQIVQAPRVLDLAHLLGRAALVLGNDSGVTHLSAALGVPTVVVFGPSDPVQWAPRGPRVTVVCREGACPPCHLAQDRSGDQTVCPRFPSVGEVWEAMVEELEA